MHTEPFKLTTNCGISNLVTRRPLSVTQLIYNRVLICPTTFNNIFTNWKLLRSMEVLSNWSYELKVNLAKNSCFLLLRTDNADYLENLKTIITSLHNHIPVTTELTLCVNEVVCNEVWRLALPLFSSNHLTTLHITIYDSTENILEFVKLCTLPATVHTLFLNIIYDKKLDARLLSKPLTMQLNLLISNHHFLRRVHIVAAHLYEGDFVKFASRPRFYITVAQTCKEY